LFAVDVTFDIKFLSNLHAFWEVIFKNFGDVQLKLLHNIFRFLNDFVDQHGMFATFEVFQSFLDEMLSLFVGLNGVLADIIYPSIQGNICLFAAS